MPDTQTFVLCNAVAATCYLDYAKDTKNNLHMRMIACAILFQREMQYKEMCDRHTMTLMNLACDIADETQTKKELYDYCFLMSMSQFVETNVYFMSTGNKIMLGYFYGIIGHVPQLRGVMVSREWYGQLVCEMMDVGRTELAAELILFATWSRNSFTVTAWTLATTSFESIYIKTRPHGVACMYSQLFLPLHSLFVPTRQRRCSCTCPIFHQRSVTNTSESHNCTI